MKYICFFFCLYRGVYERLLTSLAEKMEEANKNEQVKYVSRGTCRIIGFFVGVFLLRMQKDIPSVLEDLCYNKK